MTLFTDDGVLDVAAQAREVFDVSGAGDTVVAVLAAMLAAGVPLRDAVTWPTAPAASWSASWAPRRSRPRSCLRIMIIVTGAAGFIGAISCKALNARGETDIIAVDNLTRADKFRNLIDCEIADYLDKARVPRRCARRSPAGASDLSPGCLLGHDGNRRPLHDGQQLPLLARTARVVPGQGRAVHLCVVGLGLRRRAGVRREREHERPLNVYGYSKFLFDQIVRRRLPSVAPRRWSVCATSTSTARAKRTRDAWRRWHFITSTSFATEGK